MIINGRKIAEGIRQRLKRKVADLPFQPLFCDILVGDDPVSAQYVAMKGRAAQGVGIGFERADLPSDATTENVLAEIARRNEQPHMSGLIIQLPLPAHIDRSQVLDAIDPRIDVDCTGAINTKLFYDGQAGLVFPTAAAVIELLDFTEVDLRNKQILVVGQGALVGKPVTFLLRQRGLSVTTADKDTVDVPGLIRTADVVISATGQGKMITGDIVKPGAVVVDAGTSESDGGIVGDVDFDSVAPVASFLSPVPGGVGPVTVAKLLENVVKVAKNRKV